MAKSRARRASQRIVSIAAWLLAVQAWPLEVAAGHAPASGSHVEPRIGHAVRHGVSPKALREIRVEPSVASKPDPRVVLEPPSAPRPEPGPRKKDAVVQARPGLSAPDVLFQFDGAATNDNIPFSGLEVIPPDANGAAGPSHYFQAINLVFRIFDKSGNLVLGPLPNAGLWAGLGGVCSTSTATTPYVKYDTLAGRWFLSQAAFEVWPDRRA